MRWIDLGNPIPRAKIEPHEPVEWLGVDEYFLPSDPAEPNTSFRDVVRARRSQRNFAAPTIEQLARLLALACRVRAPLEPLEGLSLSTRPAPSAGALHPIHVILHRRDQERWQRYDPYSHSLVGLQTNHSPSKVRESLAEVLVGGQATVILFAAEPNLTFAKYEQACSLIWRDAGVLQGVFSLAAEALGFHWCLLGVTGEPWVSGLFRQNALVGVGAAYLGAPG
jgi:SagB-type dehydrogenase family enzyme